MDHDEERGHWLATEGDVYDVTEFVRMYPGGATILRAYSGMDGSEGYRRSHHGRTEIDAMPEMVADFRQAPGRNDTLREGVQVRATPRARRRRARRYRDRTFATQNETAAIRFAMGTG